MAVIKKLHRLYVGSVTVRDAALFLRATTPKPDVPVHLWRPRPNAFVATSRALYTWIRLGMEWEQPLRVTSRERVITFQDLIRLRMVTLMRARGLPYRVIRQAEDYARELTNLPQPFVTEDLWTGYSDVFMKYQEHLLAITRRGQLALGLETLRDYLSPLHHGLTFGNGVAQVWSPHPGVIIDPEIQFGAPCIPGTRVETEVLWSFHRAGETEASLARMYRLRPEQVSAAIKWERTVALAA